MKKSKPMVASAIALLLCSAITLPSFLQASTSNAISDIQQHQDTKINLNDADAKALAKSMKGVGQKRAEAIVEYRDEHGAFTSLDQLVQIKGISQAFIDKNRSEFEQKILIK